MTWTDDFNRANGAVANGWTDLGPEACVLDGGYPTSVGTTTIIRSFAGSDGNQDCTVQFNRNGNTGYTPSLVLKSDLSGANYYYANINTADALHHAFVYKVTSGGAPVTIGSAYFMPAPTATPTLVFSYTSGSLSLSVNGSVEVTVSDSDFAANAYLGLKGPGLVILVNDWSTSFSSDVPKSVTDTIAAADAPAITAQVDRSDLINAADALVVSGQIPGTTDDIGVTDAIGIGKTFGLDDPIVVVDTVLVTNQVAVADTILVTDDLGPMTVYVERNENVAVVDSLTVDGRRGLHGHPGLRRPTRRTSSRTNG